MFFGQNCYWSPLRAEKWGQKTQTSSLWISYTFLINPTDSTISISSKNKNAEYKTISRPTGIIHLHNILVQSTPFFHVSTFPWCFDHLNMIAWLVHWVLWSYVNLCNHVFGGSILFPNEWYRQFARNINQRCCTGECVLSGSMRGVAVYHGCVYPGCRIVTLHRRIWCSSFTNHHC